MKPVLLAALLAAILSSLLTVMVERVLLEPPAPRTGGSARTEIRGFLPEVERELESIRVLLAEAAESRSQVAPAPPAAGSRAAPSEEVRTNPAPGSPSSPESAGRSKGAAPGTATLGRFREVEILDRENGATITREKAKSAWILEGEEAVVAWFGKPTSIDVADNGQENWIYRLPTGEAHDDGEPKLDEYIVNFNRGRVVDIHGSW